MSIDTMWEAHEQRIRTVEKAATDFAAHVAAEELRFQMISDQITGLAEKVTEGISDLSKKVDEQVKRAESHNDALKKLRDDLDNREKRRRLFKRILVASGIAVATALWGEFAADAWKWVKLHVFFQ